MHTNTQTNTQTATKRRERKQIQNKTKNSIYTHTHNEENYLEAMAGTGMKDSLRGLGLPVDGRVVDGLRLVDVMDAEEAEGTLLLGMVIFVS